MLGHPFLRSSTPCFYMLLLPQANQAMLQLTASFFQRDVLQVAPELLGKVLATPKHRALITEVEAYRGEEDLACHASKGRTPRTEIMYHEGGHLYT